MLFCYQKVTMLWFLTFHYYFGFRYELQPDLSGALLLFLRKKQKAGTEGG
jgi:hypothetical protein